jgi:stage V sporulation protein B
VKKNKFLTSTFILLIGAVITKILGMLIKVIMTRAIGLEGISIYMLILPTFMLFINISVLGYPIAISKLVAENKKGNKNIVFSIIPFSLFLNFLLLIIIILLGPYISKLLLDERTLLPIIAIGFVLPFISLSSIIRGYFFGKEQMLPHTISNIFEQIMRLLLIIIFTSFLLKYSLKITIAGIILINIFSELTSIIILLCFLPKNIKINKSDIKPDLTIIKDILNIGIPTTGSRLIGSLGYFLEPFILSFILIKVGYTNIFFIREYGILNGYVFPLLMMPSFLIQTIGIALIPAISKGYSKKNLHYVKNKLKQGLIISLFLGIITTFLLIIQPEFFLKLVYNTTAGKDYIKEIAPFFLFYYIQAPLTATLQAINRAKEAMLNTLIGMIIKICLLISLSFLKIGMYSLIISNIVNMIIVTSLNFYKIKKAFK